VSANRRILFAVATTLSLAHIATRRSGKRWHRREHRPVRPWVDDLAPLLASRARVLDLGCGAGVPATKLLAEEASTSSELIYRPCKSSEPADWYPERVSSRRTWPPGNTSRNLRCRGLVLRPDTRAIQDQRNLLPRFVVGFVRAAICSRSSVSSAGRASRSTRRTDVLGPRRPRDVSRVAHRGRADAALGSLSCPKVASATPLYWRKRSSDSAQSFRRAGPVQGAGALSA